MYHGLNNSDWHVVSITQPHPKKLNLLLDHTESATITFPNSSQSLDLTGHLYVGGIPEVLAENVSSAIAASVSFAGCLASVFIDGQLFNLITDSIDPSGLVTPGCTGEAMSSQFSKRVGDVRSISDQVG